MNHFQGCIIRIMALVIVFACGGPAFAQTVRTNYHFRFPHGVSFKPESGTAALAAGARPQWLRVQRDHGSTNLVELGSRLVVQLKAPDDLDRLTAGRGLQLLRTVSSNVFVLQAADAGAAAEEAQRLAALPEVLSSYPVVRRHVGPDNTYAAHTDDPFFIPYFDGGFSGDIGALWPLENIEYDGDNAGTRLGLDLNVLAAWPFAQGEGVTVAVADCGLDTIHRELTNRMVGAPHLNFGSITNVDPLGNSAAWTHGTSCAGLIAAEGNNGHGMVGVAPLARLASWVIYDTNGALVADDRLMDMYQYAPDAVQIQNHSWGGGNFNTAQVGPTLLEQIGIANAVALGRNGLGTVMVRSAGNDRGLAANADDDGYPNNPEVIAVSAVSRSGRATSYSEPGACILLGAPSGETGAGLFTLDLAGPGRGNNPITYFDLELNDYLFGVYGFVGTSASAPLVSGVAALMLSANTNLSYRDVQQILVLSARQWDVTDPDLVTNSVGFPVSHNSGFGVPDAGHAVRLARLWTNRPPLTAVTMSDNTPRAITDAGLRVEVSGTAVPSELASVVCFPTLGPHPDQPTLSLPLVDIGVAWDAPLPNLTNKGALILRDDDNIDIGSQIYLAAEAGAALAVIYNSPTYNWLDLGLVLYTDFTTIPAAIIGNTSGELLKACIQTNATATARIRLQSTNVVFHVNSTLLCEQVGVRVRTDHPLRGDLRITLLSPGGTRSVLQHLNDDANPGPEDWTYWTTHNFFEGSAGDWTVAVSDEATGATGSVRSVSLILRGTQITDTDQDGLDDAWEMAQFQTLAFGPKDDPDDDNFSNAREQLMGTDPVAWDEPFRLDLVPWQVYQAQRLRLSWPGGPDNNYEVWAGTNAGLLYLQTNLAGTFPDTTWFSPYTGIPQQFFRIKAVPVP